MKHEDFARYERQAEIERVARFGAPPLTEAEKIAALRQEVDGLAGRLKAELLDELRHEIERLIDMEVHHANR